MSPFRVQVNLKPCILNPPFTYHVLPLGYAKVPQNLYIYICIYVHVYIYIWVYSSHIQSSRPGQLEVHLTLDLVDHIPGHIPKSPLQTK